MPRLPYSNPSAARRTSYASVAAGASGSIQQTASVLLPPATNQSLYNQLYTEHISRIPRPISTEADMENEGATHIPESWGSGARDPHSHMEGSRINSSWQSWNGGLGGTTAHDFFRPSYLQGSKYLEDLETTYKESLAEKQDPAPSRSGKGSLSKSSSNVSLPKMQPSHRGMAYEIVEHQTPPVETGPGSLPSRWTQADKYNCIEIGGDGQQVKCIGVAKLQDQEAPAARTDNPMPTEAGIYYYEVTIVSKGKDGMIGVGFSSSKVSLERLPGWDPESWAYHGDDGKTYCCQIAGKQFGPTFSSEDTIGCGVNFMDNTAFFTKNGNFLGRPIYPRILTLAATDHWKRLCFP